MRFKPFTTFLMQFSFFSLPPFKFLLRSSLFSPSTPPPPILFCMIYNPGCSWQVYSPEGFQRSFSQDIFTIQILLTPYIRNCMRELIQLLDNACNIQIKMPKSYNSRGIYCAFWAFSPSWRLILFIMQFSFPIFISLSFFLSWSFFILSSSRHSPLLEHSNCIIYTPV